MPLHPRSTSGCAAVVTLQLPNPAEGVLEAMGGQLTTAKTLLSAVELGVFS